VPEKPIEEYTAQPVPAQGHHQQERRGRIGHKASKEKDPSF
jgi:hypothetical protein